MGGIYIQCGSFQGADKSGSAIDGLIDELTPNATPDQQQALRQVVRALEGEVDGDYGRLSQVDAALLAPLLQTYVEHIAQRHGSDAFALMDRDFAEDLALEYGAAKYGASRGWRLYCARDLLEACRVSSREGEDVIFTWD